MKIRIAGMALSLVAGAFAGPTFAQNTLGDLEIKTNGGISISTADGKNSVKLVGRFMFDRDFYDGMYTASDGSSSEGEIRRARLGVKGTVYSDWKYSFVWNIDDTDETADINEAYLRYVGFRPFDIWAGRFKRPLGMESLTSSKWISTIERSHIFDVVPDTRQPDFGVMLSNTLGDNLSWFAGVFDDGDEDPNTGRDSYAYHGRLVYTPLRRKTQVIHVALAFADQNPASGETTRVQSRLGIHTLSSSAFQFSDTVQITSDNQFAFEAAWMDGPLSLQAEYLNREIDTTGGAAASQIDVNGGYAQLAWTITGESRSYKWPAAYFGQIKPRRKSGAWELVAKYDFVDVSNVGVGESDARSVTAGVNWYANNNFKFMLNYLRSSINNVSAPSMSDDDGDAITARLQFAF